MSEAQLLANQKTLLKNQARMLENQAAIQAKLDVLLTNQEKILAK